MVDNYTVSESYTLPSKGLIYDKPINPNIELRSMTTREEMRRMSPSKTPYKALSDIIEQCIVNKPDIHVYDMCIGDYEFLLHKLRIISYGADYKQQTVCPYCGALKESTIDLDTLKIIPFDEKEFNELRTVELERCKKTVRLKFETPRMLDEIEAHKKDYAKADFDPTILLTLEQIIDTVDNQKLSYGDLENFINSLPVKDLNRLRNRIEKLNRKVGLDTEVKCSCDQCGGDYSTFFRYQPEFFRPVED